MSIPGNFLFARLSIEMASEETEPSSSASADPALVSVSQEAASSILQSARDTLGDSTGSGRDGNRGEASRAAAVLASAAKDESLQPSTEESEEGVARITRSLQEISASLSHEDIDAALERGKAEAAIARTTSQNEKRTLVDVAKDDARNASKKGKKEKKTLIDVARRTYRDAFEDDDDDDGYSPVGPGSPLRQTSAWGRLFQGSARSPSPPSRKVRSSRSSRHNERARRPSRGGHKKSSKPRARSHKDECTFAPKINRKSRELAKNRGGGGQEAFLARMEASVRSKGKKLDTTKQEQEYNARPNKKMCPKCQSFQTYDEFVKRKKRCGQCGSVYRHKTRWNDIQSSFFERQEKREQDRRIAQKALERATRPSFTISHKEVVEGGRTRKVRTKKVAWSSVKHGFMERMEADARHREVKAKLRSEVTGMECTFEPDTSMSSASISYTRSLGSVYDRMERDSHRRHVETMRRKQHAGKYDLGLSHAPFGDEGASSRILSKSGGVRRNPAGRWM